MAVSSPAALFSDVPESEANHLFINYLANKGLVKGYPDGTFRPNEGLTRAEAAAMLTYALGLAGEAPWTAGFTDVPSGHWAAKSIWLAYNAGIIKGYPDGTFRPEAELTRAEGISLALRLTKQPDPGTAQLQMDDLPPGHWASRPAAIAVSAGMIGLSEDNRNFYPDAAITRGDFSRALAVILTRDPENYKTPLAGELEVVKGSITFIRDNVKTALEVNRKKALQPGDVIITGNDGAAEIQYPDGTGLRLEGDTELEIKEAVGRSYIKNGGIPGQAVEWLNIGLKRGKLFGALATSYNTPARSSEASEGTGQNQITGKSRYILLASLDDGAALESIGIKKLAANQPSPAGQGAGNKNMPWWEVSQTKRAKVKVDMPWGVAAIRGTFWQNSVHGDGSSSTSLLTGEGEVTSGDETVGLTGGQSTGITGPGAPPSPPAPNGPEENQEWLNESQWVQQQAQQIQQNQEAQTPPPPPAQQGSPGVPPAPEQPPQSAQQPPQATQPPDITQTIDSALQQAGRNSSGNPGASSPDNPGNTGASSPGGGGGGGGGGSSNRTAAQVAERITSISAPVVNATSLTLPDVPSGFTVTIKTTDNPDIITLDGKIRPQGTAASVNLVLTVTKRSDNTVADTIVISVTVPAKMTAREVADGITSIEAPLPNIKRLTLPQMPGGFAIAIKSTGNPAVIATDCKITPPEEETPVLLVLEISSTVIDDKALTSPITVIVPALARTAQEVAASITGITAPARDATELTLPGMPAGFRIGIKTSSNLEVIKLNARIAPPDEETTVQLVLTVTKTSDRTTADTAVLPVVVPAATLTAERVAKKITAIPQPAPGDKQLTLPVVPQGFAVSIKTSDKPEVIALDGKINPGEKQQTVTIVLTVTRLSDGTKADTAALPVVVPTGGLTAAQVAAGITGIASPSQGDAVITLPAVPEGFTVSIKSSSNPGVISPGGAITPGETDMVVYLVLTVTKLSDNTTADTSTLPVIVPARPVVNPPPDPPPAPEPSVLVCNVTTIAASQLVYQIFNLSITGDTFKDNITVNDIALGGDLCSLTVVEVFKNTDGTLYVELEGVLERVTGTGTINIAGTGLASGKESETALLNVLWQVTSGVTLRSANQAELDILKELPGNQDLTAGAALNVIEEIVQPQSVREEATYKLILWNDAGFSTTILDHFIPTEITDLPQAFDTSVIISTGPGEFYVLVLFINSEKQLVGYYQTPDAVEFSAPGTVTGLNVTADNTAPLAPCVQYTVNFNTSEDGALTDGIGTITVIFPNGYIVPELIASGNVLVYEMPSSIVSVTGQEVTITTPVYIDGGEPVQVRFLNAAGIGNPESSGMQTFSVHTSADPVYATCDVAIGMPVITGVMTIPAPLHQGYVGTPEFIINGANLSSASGLTVAGQNLSINNNTPEQIVVTLPNDIPTGNYGIVVAIGSDNITFDNALVIREEPSVTEDNWPVYVLDGATGEPVKMPGVVGLDDAPVVKTGEYPTNGNATWYDDGDTLAFTPAYGLAAGKYDVVATNSDGTSVPIEDGLVVLPGEKVGEFTDGTGPGVINCIVPLEDTSSPSGSVYLVKAGSVPEATDIARWYGSNTTEIWDATESTVVGSITTTLRGSGGNLYAVWVSEAGEVEDAVLLFEVDALSDGALGPPTVESIDYYDNTTIIITFTEDLANSSLTGKQSAFTVIDSADPPEQYEVTSTSEGVEANQIVLTVEDFSEVTDALKISYDADDENGDLEGFGGVVESFIELPFYPNGV
ncbi:hypothetical protein DCCM_4477 [Desulfocucumis palustris]|uniref:SLH domain-containing protein n=2 Tax=Desulfocucumis palustris TaxID=1898651 RepID=A0A2L2XH92_9FIRM|nr:hypothetical protein DCCM_4477 [Desulfocucumis palustris]